VGDAFHKNLYQKNKRRVYMAEATTYLELSEDGGGAHKFYEIITSGTEVRIRYGRIGDAGQTQVSQHSTEAKAQQFVQKKLNEKIRKGYAPAVMGQRQKRRVTRRPIATTPPPVGYSAGRQAPVLWRFDSGHASFGIFVNEQHCWLGNEAGHIFGLDHNGQVQKQYTLPDGVKCLVADDIWLYAGCDDGNVYDLSGKIPRISYKIAPDVDIFWLDILHGSLAVSDAEGRVALVNHEDESEWLKSTVYSHGWMVRCGNEGVYHGHNGGVSMYSNRDGSLVWEQRTRGAVLFGWQEEQAVYAGTSDNRVYSFSKQGQPSTIYQCDHAIFSCATAEQGKYVFAGDSYGAIYCFAQDGQRLWKLATGCGAAYSMQYFKERLYIVTTQGYMACMDVSEAAIQAAQGGVLPQTMSVKAPPVVASPAPTTLEVASAGTTGVTLECFREGSKLRMRVISSGYNAALRVQFPINIREENARYIVDEVRLAANGGFYRAYGNIRKLV
jgi:predicted DNA-binding WGR domain protein/outer membrane protein assembly factor BamB